MLLHKIFRRFKSVVSVLRGSLSSYIGMRIALRHAVTQEPAKWRQDFTGSRVLVVGTGPSLDHVTNDYFAGFDVVICVNHAILTTPAHHCKYYLSTDVPRTHEVINTEASETIAELPGERRILFLSFVLTGRYLLSDFLQRFTIVKYKAYCFHKWGTGRLSKRYFQPKVATDADIEGWINGNAQFKDMPSRGGSSVFSAVLLAARYHPTEIRLIGVDLNAGRSSALEQLAGPAIFGAEWPRERFSRLEKAVKDCGVPIYNDSWSVVPTK